MNITFIKNIAKKYPALARSIEIGVYALMSYIIGALIAGEALNIHAMLVSLLTPFYAYLGKIRRDLNQ